MTAATADQLAAIAQRARVRSLATVPTRGRYISTFANGAVTGGATWMYSRPDGRVFMVRVSPRRVWLDLQAAMAAALPRPLRVDAIVGPETSAALEAYTHAPAGTPLVHMLAPALLQVYHQGLGSLVVPTPVELPDPRRLVEIRGDAAHHSIIDLTGSIDSAARTVVRTATNPDVARDEIQRVGSVIAQAPPAPAPRPSTTAAQPAPSPSPSSAPSSRPEVRPDTRPTAPPQELSESDKCRWYQDAHARDPSIAIPPTCQQPDTAAPPSHFSGTPTPPALSAQPATAPPPARSTPSSTRVLWGALAVATVATLGLAVVLWKPHTPDSTHDATPGAAIPLTRGNPSRRRLRR